MSTNGFSREPFEESGLSLYEAIVDQGDAMDRVASDWVNMYKEENDHTNSLLVLVNFIIRSCGCSEIIAREGFEDDDAIPQVLEELQDAFKKELVADYPLISKSREFRKFRKNFLTFFRQLIDHVKHDVLYDGVFFETIQIWVVPMSSSSFRPFRHTATIIALHLFSCLCELAQEVHNSWTIASRQLSVEKRTKSPRNSKNMDRINELQSKTQDLDKKKRQLDVYFEDLFDSVFVHRYRDVEAIIRAECIKELGIWVFKYPSRFLDDTNIRYLGWQLSDKSPIVRLESLKVLEQLYINETLVTGLRNFTSRFKPRLLEMALREIDMNVRIASIQMLTTIHKVGMLDTEDCDQLSLLIYYDITRIRKAIAPFVKETLEQDFIREKMSKVQTFLATSGGTKRKRVNGSGNSMYTAKKEWVEFKCLAEFLVKYAKVIDDAQKEDRMDDEMEEEEEFEDGILTQSLGDVENSRISLAIQDLWTELDLLHQWQKLADYLSKDHSIINQSRTPKGGGISADTIEECYRLSEQEESVLIQVFVKCLQLTLSDYASKDKKKVENHIDETRDEISRNMVTILPKLLTKYAPDAGRIAEVLRIPLLMNMDVYSDLRIDKAYEVLVEDIVKLYLKHTHPVVLSHAAATFQHMKQYKNFASMTETRLGELQEEVIKTFLGECENKTKEISTMDLTSDQVHSLCVALSRLEQLITVMNFVDAVEVCDENNQSVYNCIIRLVRRGLLGNVEEEKIVLSTINFLWYYILWKVANISPNEAAVEDISLDVLNDLIGKRDQIRQTLCEVGISYGSQALPCAKSTAFRTIGNIYWLFASDIFHHSNGTNLSELKLPCQSELQDRIADFVEEEIASFRESYTEAESKLEQEIRKEEEEEETSEDGEKPVKRSRNVEMFINPEEKIRIMDIIGTLLRGVRGGWLNVSHAAVVICNYGTIGCDLDDVIKKLLLEFKERISSGDDAKLFASVCMKSLRKSQFLYVDGKVRTMNATMSLARICANTLQLRDTSDKSSHKDMDHVVELHSSGIQHICSLINAYQILNDAEGKECFVRSIQFFKILSRLFGGMTCNDAQKIESILKEEFEKNKIQVVESEKLWEPYCLYIQKINNILAKGGARKEQTVSESSKKRTVNNKKRRRTSDSRRNTKDYHVDSNSENQENNEGFATSTVCKPRSSNITQSFGDEDVNNSYANSESSSPSLKRSTPINDIEITKSPAKKRKSQPKKRTIVEMEEASNEEKPENDGSDSDGSYQSLSDVRTSRVGKVLRSGTLKPGL